MSDEPSPEADAPITPGERLLYALGQLYRHARNGELDVEPRDFDIWDLAGILGVRGDVEFVSEGRGGAVYHFADEVFVFDQASEFPWRLLTLWEWAVEREFEALAAEDEG